MKSLLCFVLLAMLFFNVKAGAVEATQPNVEFKKWSDFERIMQDSKQHRENEGMSYILSGSLAVIGGTIGYNQEPDALGRLMLSVTQSIGVAAIAFGSEQYFLGSEYQSFYLALKESKLSDESRSEILSRYFDHERNKKKKSKWIRILSHSLIATLNFYQASQESNSNVKTGLAAIGVLNLGLAVHYSF